MTDVVDEVVEAEDAAMDLHAIEPTSGPSVMPASCSAASGGHAGGGAPDNTQYIYALGKVDIQFANEGLRREFGAALEREGVSTCDSSGKLKTTGTLLYELLTKHDAPATDDEKICVRKPKTTVFNPEYLYLAQDACWVLSIGGVHSYQLFARYDNDFDALIQALKPATDPSNQSNLIDLAIGEGTLAPASQVCSSLGLPTIMISRCKLFNLENFARCMLSNEGWRYPLAADASKIDTDCYPFFKIMQAIDKDPSSKVADLKKAEVLKLLATDTTTVDLLSSKFAGKSLSQLCSLPGSDDDEKKVKALAESIRDNLWSVASLIAPAPDPQNDPLKKATTNIINLFKAIVSASSDNLGSMDEDRALNYLAVSYVTLYKKTCELVLGADPTCKGVETQYSLPKFEVIPSATHGSQKVMDVILTYTNVCTHELERYIVRVDVTSMYPYVVEPLQRYYG